MLTCSCFYTQCTSLLSYFFLVNYSMFPWSTAHPSRVVLCCTVCDLCGTETDQRAGKSIKMLKHTKSICGRVFGLTFSWMWKLISERDGEAKYWHCGCEAKVLPVHLWPHPLPPSLFFSLWHFVAGREEWGLYQVHCWFCIVCEFFALMYCSCICIALSTSNKKNWIGHIHYDTI